MIFNNPKEIDFESKKEELLEQFVNFVDLQMKAGDKLIVNQFGNYGYSIRIYKDPNFKIKKNNSKEYNLAMIEMFFRHCDTNILCFASNDLCISEYEFERTISECCVKAGVFDD